MFIKVNVSLRNTKNKKKSCLFAVRRVSTYFLEVFVHKTDIVRDYVLFCICHALSGPMSCENVFVFKLFTYKYFLLEARYVN